MKVGEEKAMGMGRQNRLLLLWMDGSLLLIFFAEEGTNGHAEVGEWNFLFRYLPLEEQ